MGENLRVFCSHNSWKPRVVTGNELSKRCLFASVPWDFYEKTSKCIISMKQGTGGSRATSDIVVFLLTTAALEVVRRLSRTRFPFVWRGLQVLQVFCYPPFKWIQRWAPFNYLVKYMQKLSRPLLVLTVATVFSDNLGFTEETSSGSDISQSNSETPSAPPPQSSILDKSSCDDVRGSLPAEKWLVELYEELEKQGITLPERLDEDELRRFHTAANGEFSRLLSSIKKTIHWRQTYTLFSRQELEAWSHLVFWHGCDAKQQPCLIIRLGLACSNLKSTDRPLFIKAVVSQIERGIVSLVGAQHSQIAVLMDCDGLSPFGFPMQMMRSCAILLQDHYPNCLGCLIVIRLAPFARVITQALFQVLRPATRQKLRILGENYAEVLSEYIQTLPSFLGGKCPCPICSGVVDAVCVNEESIEMGPSADHTPDENGPSSNFCSYTNTSMNGSRKQMLRTAVIGVLMFWILVAFVLAMHYPEYLHLL